ncbi:asparaginase [Paenibacillus taiwanensis]|uniref:asparaginase n=1 Tax=Paenibacillus taiwanensis TaxID=401638 RepID=UPI0003F57AF1|nr:asparaginase [Paenibacillus taiwanensis]
MKPFTELVKEYRAGVLENVHYGAVCVVNETGEVIYKAGDPEHVVFLRSAAKPFQAIPVMKRRVDHVYGLTGEEASLFAASHRGEAFHIAALASIAQKTGISEEQLYCCPSLPLNEQAKAERIMNGETKRRIFHNCAGKHLGLLALCKQMGWDEKSYYELEHPVQQEILSVVSAMTEVPKERIAVGVDGCGLPIHAVPLHTIGRAYLKLACPDLIREHDIREAAERIASLMNENPTMIADTHFVCSALLQDANISAKGGAKGVYGIGLRKERLGIALKVSDGSEQVWPCIIASILERLGYDQKDTIARLYEIVPNTIYNDGGFIVGEREAVFEWA